MWWENGQKAALQREVGTRVWEAGGWLPSGRVVCSPKPGRSH